LSAARASKGRVSSYAVSDFLKLIQAHTRSMSETTARKVRENQNSTGIDTVNGHTAGAYQFIDLKE